MTTPASAPASADHPSLAVRSYGLSHPGRVRENNEDVFVVGELARTLIVRHTNVPQSNETHSRHRGHVFLVADGVGGNEAGDVASRLGATSVEEFLLNTFHRFAAVPSTDGQAALRELQAALQRADARLFDAAGRHPSLRGMGTTLTLAIARSACASFDTRNRISRSVSVMAVSMCRLMNPISIAWSANCYSRQRQIWFTAVPCSAVSEPRWPCSFGAGQRRR